MSQDCPEILGQIVKYMCWENRDFTTFIVQGLNQGIEKAGYDTARSYFDMMVYVVDVEDSLQHERIQTLMSVTDIISSFKFNQSRLMYTSIRGLVKVMESSQRFMECLMKNRTNWAWIDQWLKNYVGRTRYPIVATRKKRSEFYESYKALVEKYGGTMKLPSDEHKTHNSDGEHSGAGAYQMESDEEMEDTSPKRKKGNNVGWESLGGQTRQRASSVIINEGVECNLNLEGSQLSQQPQLPILHRAKSDPGESAIVAPANSPRNSNSNEPFDCSACTFRNSGGNKCEICLTSRK